MSQSLRVLVTGVGGGGLGEQLLKALRLADTPYRLLAADVTRESVGLTLADETCLLPPARDPGYLDALVDVVERLGPRVVIPASEPELRVVARDRARLEALGVFVPIQPAEVIDRCDDKAETHAFLSARGFVQPRFVRVDSLEQLEAFDLFPCVLKPVSGGSGSSNVFVVQDRAELLALGAYALRAAGSLVVEEYVGRADSEFTVGVLHDLDGGLLHSIAIRRQILSGLSNRIRVHNRTGRAELGELLAISSGVSQGVIEPFDEVRAVAERVADAVGSRGPLNVQCRVHQGEVVVFEINPRFSGTASLRALVGFNEADVLIRKHVLGEWIVPRFEHRYGTVLRGLRETFFPPAAAGSGA